ncbi:MAG TPA: helix-turn-helix domain-containing protein [Thermoleophilaceae bacterium]
MPPPRRPLLTPRDVAEQLQISRSTLYEMLRRGELPSYKIAGARRIDPDDLDRYLTEQREHGTGRATQR